MGRVILKVEDPIDRKEYYLEWSSIVEMPVTWGVTLPDFADYYRWQYGRDGANRLREHLEYSKTAQDFENCGTFECSVINQERGIKDAEDLLNRFCRRRIG